MEDILLSTTRQQLVQTRLVQFPAALRVGRKLAQLGVDDAKVRRAGAHNLGRDWGRELELATPVCRPVLQLSPPQSWVLGDLSGLQRAESLHKLRARWQSAGDRDQQPRGRGHICQSRCQAVGSVWQNTFDCDNSIRVEKRQLR